MRVERVALALAACAMAILWIGACTDLDLILARSMYDPIRHVFPARHAWFAENLSHNGVKVMLLLLAICVVLGALSDLLWPRAGREPGLRLRLRVVALCAILVPLVISILKHASASHCPWDLEMFGGSEVYVRLLEAVPANTPYGHCMPAGHASGQLWMVAFAVFWLPHRPLRAALVGAVMLAGGFALGWVQQMRGAHFLTHTLWSMWLTCLIVTLVYLALVRRESLQRLYANAPGQQLPESGRAARMSTD